MANVNAAELVNEAGIALGLYSTAVANPFASTDASVVQLVQALKDVCRDLVREYNWQHLQGPATFSTVNGTESYSLPAGFLRIIDGTFWNRTTQRPLVGPVGPQEWQALKAQTSTGTEQYIFRIYQDEIWLHPTPTAAHTIAYEYSTMYWAADGAGETLPGDDTVEDANGVVFLDRRLIVAGIKLYWKRERGFDTSGAQLEYDKTLARALAKDGASPTLLLNGAGSLSGRLLDSLNVPETGFGS